MFAAVTLDLVDTLMAVGSLGATVTSIWLVRKPSVATLPPEMPLESRSRYVKHLAQSATSVELPAEIEERIFLAEDTPETAEDDIAARQAGIDYLEARLAEAKTPEERMPIRHRLRGLRREIAELSREATGKRSRRLASLFDPAWSLMYKLPPLRRRTRPWLAAVIGFLLGGIGLSVYFRSLIDILVFVTLIVATVLMGTLVEASDVWWVGAAIAAFYGFVRAESSNRRRALSAG